MFYVVLAVVVLLLLIAGFMHFCGDLFSELDHFLYLVAALFVIVIGAGIFLSIAVPSIASNNPFAKSKQTEEVTQDDMIGLPLLEEEAADEN